MTYDKTEIRAWRAPWSNSVSFAILRRRPDDAGVWRREYLDAQSDPPVWRELPDGEATDPTGLLHVGQQTAEALVSMLWECGCRPHQADGSLGQLDAQSKHLNDMRALVSKALEVKLEHK